MLSTVLLSGISPPPDLIERLLERVQRDIAANRSLSFTVERREYEIDGQKKKLKKREFRHVRAGADDEPFKTNISLILEKYELRPIVSPPVSIDGFECWQVSMTPRDGLRDETDMDAILNRLSGTAYVDVETYLVRSMHATLIKNFRRGFLGMWHVTDATMDSRLQEWGVGRVGVQHTTVARITYSVLGSVASRVIEYYYTDYDARQP